MHRTLPVWLVLLGSSLVPAQDTPNAADQGVATKQRLVAALQKTLATPDVAFAATWGPNPAPKANDQAAMWFAVQGGKATGSWHEGVRHVTFDGDNGDEIVVAGDRSLAKDKDRDWCLRVGHLADGNTVPFAADIPLVLELLAAMDLAIVQRTVGSIDDRPVEIVTATLNPDQVAELAWSGALPDGLFSGNGAFAFGGMAGNGQRPPAPKPEATLDVAIALDPATSLVHDVHFRSWTKNSGNGRHVVFRGGAGAIVQVAGAGQGDDDEEEEDEKTAAAAKAAPMQYENGLPVRPRKKMAVADFAVRLRDHGTAKAPELTDAQRKLLRR